MPNKACTRRWGFGGGGITPDIETESDLLTQFGAELRRKNAFFNFTVDYMVEHDHTVEKDIKITDSLMQRFLGYAKSLDIKYTQADLDSADTYIRTMKLRGWYEDLAEKWGLPPELANGP